MKQLISNHLVAAVAIGLGGFAAASSAHARSDVYFSIGVQVPGVYLEAAPVYVQPRPFYSRAPEYYWRHDDDRRDDRVRWQRPGPYGDLNRDGIMYRHDRDRHGDRVGNQYDRYPNYPNPLMATSKSPTYGQSNSPRQDGEIISLLV